MKWRWRGIALFFLAHTTMAGSPTNMVMVQGGTFMRGDTWGDGASNQRPANLVTLDSFEISECEVTLGEVSRVLNWAYENGKIKVKKESVESNEIKPKDILLIYDFQWDGQRFSPKGDPNLPCRSVSWYGAALYCNYRSEMEGLDLCYDPKSVTRRWDCDFEASGYRLPTEAEWEYAARGGTLSKNTKYSGSSVLELVGWYKDNNGRVLTTHQERRRNSEGNGDNDEWTIFTYTEVVSPPKVFPVGTKIPNELGLFDMSGNVAEWCNDWYGDYKSEPVETPQGMRESIGGRQEKVLRGGNYLLDATDCRVDSRMSGNPNKVFSGFRIARTILKKNPSY
jgi:formylglycine-generating enzyme required for sulfatase activity